MPATITHAFFAKDIYDILSEDISSELDLNRLKMFAQGTDSLLFYNLFSILPGKDIRKLQRYTHDNKTRDFFVNMLEFIKENNIKDKDVYSFLVGFICHYALDSTVHPYVYYKTGCFNKKKPETYKYNNVHHFMEIFIDNDMVRRRLKINPYTYDFPKYCFDLREFSNDLNHVINYSFYSTYKIRAMREYYYKSLKQMKRDLKLFRRDPSGIKKGFYKVLDTLTPRSCFRFEAISYHYPLEDKNNFLNKNHNIWKNPVDDSITSNESFIDLYIRAIKLARDLIEGSFDYLNGKDIKLDELFKNNSYLTGLDCDNKKELKYFEF